MNTLNLNFNLYLYLNLNSVLLLLLILPSHLGKRCYYLLSALLLGKKSGAISLKQIRQVFRSGLGLYGGLVSTYPTTTRRQDSSVSPPGPSHTGYEGKKKFSAPKTFIVPIKHTVTWRPMSGKPPRRINPPHRGPSTLAALAPDSAASDFFYFSIISFCIKTFFWRKRHGTEIEHRICV